MTEEERVQQFVQDVYLTRYNRTIDDIESTDGLAEVDKTISWTNMFLDELEQETDSNAQPMNWSFARENDVNLGTVAASTTSVDIDDDILRLVIDENRPLTIQQDGSAVSHWDVVAPNQITARNDRSTGDRVTVINRQIIFSRALNESEVGGTIVADVINAIPRLTRTDASTLDTVKPYQLLVLGVAKNATLPDIVQGGLSPSFVQKYADLLLQAKANNDASSTASDLVREDFSGIGGIY